MSLQAIRDLRDQMLELAAKTAESLPDDTESPFSLAERRRVKEEIAGAIRRLIPQEVVDA